MHKTLTWVKSYTDFCSWLWIVHRHRHTFMYPPKPQQIDAQTTLSMAKLRKAERFRRHWQHPNPSDEEWENSRPSFVKCVCCWLPNIVKEQRGMDSAFLRRVLISSKTSKATRKKWENSEKLWNGPCPKLMGNDNYILANKNLHMSTCSKERKWAIQPQNAKEWHAPFTDNALISAPCASHVEPGTGLNWTNSVHGVTCICFSTAEHLLAEQQNFSIWPLSSSSSIFGTEIVQNCSTQKNPSKPIHPNPSKTI